MASTYRYTSLRCITYINQCSAHRSIQYGNLVELDLKSSINASIQYGNVAELDLNYQSMQSSSINTVRKFSGVGFKIINQCSTAI